MEGYFSVAHEFGTEEQEHDGSCSDLNTIKQYRI